MKKLNIKEVDMIRNILKLYPEIFSLLGKDWIDKNLLKQQERKKVHPLAWILLDPKKNEEFLNGIQLLVKADYPRLASFIRDDIKKTTSLYELRPLYTELHVYKKFSDKVGLDNSEFRPAIEKLGKEADLRIILDDNDIFVEVLTVIDDEVSRRQNELSTELSEQIDKLIESKGIVVSLVYKRVLDKDKVQYILEELKLHLDILKDKIEIPVLQDGQEIAVIEVEKNEKEAEGYVASWIGPGRGVSVGNREKNKILDKLDKYQFPEEARAKGIIVHLDSMLSGELNILNAILGLQVLKVDIETGETISTRSPNGIIHDKRARKIDFIAFYRRNDINNLQLLMNNDETGLVEKLFN